MEKRRRCYEARAACARCTRAMYEEGMRARAQRARKERRGGARKQQKRACRWARARTAGARAGRHGAGSGGEKARRQEREGRAMKRAYAAMARSAWKRYARRAGALAKAPRARQQVAACATGKGQDGARASADSESAARPANAAGGAVDEARDEEMQRVRGALAGDEPCAWRRHGREGNAMCGEGARPCSEARCASGAATAARGAACGACRQAAKVARRYGVRADARARCCGAAFGAPAGQRRRDGRRPGAQRCPAGREGAAARAWCGGGCEARRGERGGARWRRVLRPRAPRARAANGHVDAGARHARWTKTRRGAPRGASAPAWCARRRQMMSTARRALMSALHSTMEKAQG